MAVLNEVLAIFKVMMRQLKGTQKELKRAKNEEARYAEEAYRIAQ